MCFFNVQKCKYPAQHTTRQVENNELFPHEDRVIIKWTWHGEFFALLYCRRSVAARESRAIGQKGGIEMGLFYIAHTLRSIGSAYPGFFVLQAVIVGSFSIFFIFVWRRRRVTFKLQQKGTLQLCI